MTHVSAAAEDVSALWLSLLQRAMGRASHDVKDALNGVSVNLEVIRSRAGRADAPASAVAPFAEAAAQQFDRLTTLLEAVLTLTRSERTPADVGVTLRRVGALCGASASSADAAVRIEASGADSAVTSIRGDVVRIALMAPLLDAVTGADRGNRASEVTCALGGDEDAVEVVMRAAQRTLSMPETVGDVVRAAGVRWTETNGTLSLAFPRT
jgi:signal transduction histidine kinase